MAINFGDGIELLRRSRLFDGFNVHEKLLSTYGRDCLFDVEKCLLLRGVVG